MVPQRTSYRRYIACLLLSGSLLFSCTQELDYPFPQGKKQLVLNSILHPDSIIKVSLTKTLPMGTTGSDFPVVENAEIKLYEDDVLIGRPAFQDSVYMLDYQPKAGSTYRVKVEVPGFPLVKASDRMPEVVEASTCFELSDRYDLDFVGANAIQHIYIQDPIGIENSYWFYKPTIKLSDRNCDKTSGQIKITDDCMEVVPGDHPPMYYSFSTVPDRFNSYIDVLSGGITVYDFYIRVEDQSFDGQQIHFDMAGNYFPNQPEDNSEDDWYNNLQLINASQHYDRYLKSAVTYALRSDLYTDEDISFKPFSEIIQSYSNVENGTGIFGAYNSVSIAIEDHPCE
jgi:hypothetical protein